MKYLQCWKELISQKNCEPSEGTTTQKPGELFFSMIIKLDIRTEKLYMKKKKEPILNDRCGSGVLSLCDSVWFSDIRMFK